MPKYRVDLERRIGGNDTINLQKTTVDVEAHSAEAARRIAASLAFPVTWPALGPHSGVTYPIAVSAEEIRDPFGDAVREAMHKPDFSRGRW
jgi:hypothetical protein